MNKPMTKEALSAELAKTVAESGLDPADWMAVATALQFQIVLSICQLDAEYYKGGALKAQHDLRINSYTKGLRNQADKVGPMLRTFLEEQA